MSVDYGGFEDLQKKFGEMERDYVNFMRGFLLEMANRSLAKIIKRTPVDTGTLRKNWQISQVFRKGNDFYIVIYNHTQYAQWVEEGHRQTKRFVPGRWEGKKFVYDRNADGGMMLKNKWIKGLHMARISITEIELEIPKRFRKEFGIWAKQFGLEG